MAVLKIKVASIIGRMTDLDKVTEVCGKSGVFHPDNALSFYSDTSHFTPISDENPYSEPLQRISDSITASRKHLALLSQKETDSLTMSDDEIFSYVRKFSAALNDLQAERAKAQQSIQNDTQVLEEVSHFTGLDLNLNEIFLL